MNKKTVIGLIAPKQSGKTTTLEAIDKILSENGKTVSEFMIANKLKQVCGRYYSIKREVFEDQRYKEIPLDLFGLNITLGKIDAHLILSEFDKEYKKKLKKKEILNPFEDVLLNFLEERNLFMYPFKTPREILQVIGTDLLRPVLGEDCHVSQFDNKEHLSDVVVVSDIRFQNELDYFKRHKGINFISMFIYNKECMDNARNSNHISEKGIIDLFHNNDYDIAIENRKVTRYELFKDVFKALQKTGLI